MPDLISRSVLKDALKYWTHFPEHRGGKSVYDIIDDAPAVDAVENVRCKDCKCIKEGSFDIFKLAYCNV